MRCALRGAEGRYLQIFGDREKAVCRAVLSGISSQEKAENENEIEMVVAHLECILQNLKDFRDE